jgi:tetratricopeptide (TPR) repeat protein
MRYLAECEPEYREEWLIKASQESNRRENHVALATHYYKNEQWEQCLESCSRALEITEKPLDYLCEAYAWGSTAHDLAAISYYKMGYNEMARHHGIEALKISPTDERLHKNLDYYEMDKH